MSKALRPLGYVDEQGRPIVLHGFRATFRTWAMEVARASYEACETALAHGKDETVASYARSQMIEARCELMQAWADYVVPGLRL